MGKRYADIGKKWRANWLKLTAFLDFGPEVRRMIYATNAVENIHRQISKVTKAKGAWCTDKALMKQLYLSLMRIRKSWDRNVYKWSKIQQELMASGTAAGWRLNEATAVTFSHHTDIPTQFACSLE